MAKFNIKAQPIPTVASAYADILGTTDNQIVEIKNELIIEDNKQRFQIHDDTIEQLAERIANEDSYAAVDYIFSGNAAVQHRVLYMNNSDGGWHATQNFVVYYDGVWFYD